MHGFLTLCRGASQRSLREYEENQKELAAAAALAEARKRKELEAEHQKVIAETHRQQAERQEEVQAEHARQLVSEAIAAREQTRHMLQVLTGIIRATMRVELIGHFKPCMTEIYLHIDARMADFIRTHP